MNNQTQIYLVKKEGQNRLWYYVISFVSLSASVGVIGTYSIIKEELADQLGYEESFLGICDGFNFLGHLFGYCYLIWNPIKKPVRDFSMSCLLTAVIFSTIPFLSYLLQYSQQSLIVINFLMGISKAYWMVPYMIVVQYYDASNKDKKLVNIWGTLNSIGDVLAIIVLGVAMKNFSISWKYCIWVSCVALVLVAVLQDFTVQQIDAEAYNRQHGISTELTWQQAKENISSFFCQPSNLFWTIDVTLILSLYYCVLMWFPYYFIKLGFQEYSIWISITFPICLMVGSVIYQNLLSYSPLKESYVIMILLGLNFVLFLAMSFYQGQNYLWYLVLSGLIGIAYGGPFPVIASSEFMKRCEKANSFYLPYAVSKIIQILFSIFMMIIIGYFMQKNIRSFQYILCIQTGLNFLVYLFRKIYFKQIEEKSPKQQFFIPLQDI